jgi:hypothetical protein
MNQFGQLELARQQHQRLQKKPMLTSDNGLLKMLVKKLLQLLEFNMVAQSTLKTQQN